MSARDLIASAISGAPFPSRRSMAKADQAIANLAAAGYRLIGPGELDPETIERCRHATREAVLNLSPSMRKNGDILDDALFHALRSLQGGE